jgi:protein-disulfide isomerase-like protein with CxxC motif
MAIGKDKRRYSVSLTPARVDRFQALCKQLGMPPSTMSSALDDVLASLADTFQTAADNGITGVVSLMENKMEKLHEEKRKHEEGQKRDTNH